MTNNWPIGPADLRKALSFKDTDGDVGELTLFATAACETIDKKTGRDIDPTRWETNGDLPSIFTMAARETAKLWWQQSKNGARAASPLSGDQVVGPPMGAELPRKVEGWLADYPPPHGFGRPEADAGTAPPEPDDPALRSFRW